jgi:transcriptional regulator with XRE-family HTH domain
MKTTLDNHPIDVQVGQRIAARRQQLNLNQSQLGEAIGVSFQQVQKYEKGTNRVSASRLAMMADFLDVQVQDLFPSKENRATAALSPLDRQAASADGRELARLYVSMAPERQAALLTVARAIAGPAAGEVARQLEAA